MPTPEWSFFMLPEDHKEVKWTLSFCQAKFTVWGQIIFGMIIAGMTVSSVGTQTSAYLFVALIWALFLTSLILSFFFKPQVSLTLRLPTATEAGGICECPATLTNTGRKALRNIEIFFHKLPYGLYEKLDHLNNKPSCDWLAPNEHITLTLALRTPRRGSFIIKPLLIGTSFPSGLVRSLFNTKQNTPFIVFPKLLRTKENILFPNHQSQLKAKNLGSAFGSSNEFLSTREYREGDRPRDIHWNSSAKSDKLIVKEYTNEQFAHVGLVLDTELKKFEKHLCFETRISLIAGTAKTLLERNYHLHVFTTDSRLLTVHTKNNENDLVGLLTMLSSIEGNERIDFSPIAKKLKRRVRYMSELIIILKTWDKIRADFIDEIRTLGLPIKILIIQKQPLTIPNNGLDIHVYTPDQLTST